MTSIISGRKAVHEGALGDAPLDDGPDRHLPDVGQHAEDDLAAALEQARDRRLVLVERAPAGSTPHTGLGNP